MGFLNEVITTKANSDITTVRSKVPEIVTTVKSLKTDLSVYLENTHILFLEKTDVCPDIIEQSTELLEEIVNLRSSVEDLIKKEVNVGDKQPLFQYLDTLNSTQTDIENVLNLCNINKNLRNVEQYLDDNSYVICMQTIKETEEFLMQQICVENNQIVSQMIDTLQMYKASLLNEMNNVYNNNIKLKYTEDSCVVKITLEEDAIEEVLNSFHVNGSIPPFSRFIRCFWEHIVVPVVKYKTRLDLGMEEGFAVMSLHIVDKAQKPDYVTVCFLLEDVFKFVTNNLNFSVSFDGLTAINLISDGSRDKLSNLINQYLEETIPTDFDDLENYVGLAERIETLEKTLKDLKIFDENTTPILKNTNNINVMFAEKLFWDKSKKLMEKDLHDVVEIGVEQNLEDSFNTNNFSKCQVSKSLIELLEFMENQTKTCSIIDGRRLLHTIQTICTTYPAFVAEYHHKLIYSIPQQMALYYNNCTYLAYNVTNWKDVNLNKFHDEQTGVSTILIAESKLLKDVANEQLHSFVQNQIKQIGEKMKTAGLDIKILDRVQSNADKCVNQCLQQLETLKTGWQHVFPQEIYNNNIGMILNALVNCLVNQIVKFDSISTEAAAQLVELLKKIQINVPKMFTDVKDINLYVKSWAKLNELVVVLNATLCEINDRWAGGEGPLGVQFTPGELKQLIRALFPESERRSAILAKFFHC